MRELHEGKVLEGGMTSGTPRKGCLFALTYLMLFVLPSCFLPATVEGGAMSGMPPIQDFANAMHEDPELRESYRDNVRGFQGFFGNLFGLPERDFYGEIKNGRKRGEDPRLYEGGSRKPGNGPSGSAEGADGEKAKEEKEEVVNEEQAKEEEERDLLQDAIDALPKLDPSKSEDGGGGGGGKGETDEDGGKATESTTEGSSYLGRRMTKYGKGKGGLKFAAVVAGAVFGGVAVISGAVCALYKKPFWEKPAYSEENFEWDHGSELAGHDSADTTISITAL